MPLYVRPAVPQDEQFLYQLVRQVLYEQLLAGLWEPALRDNLLDMQARAKCSYYAAAFPRAENAIIMLDDQPVGRLLVDRSGAFYNLIDISVLSKHRSSGIGTRLILGLCMEAEMMGKSVRLYVSVTNPRTAALYKRLGFRLLEDLQSDWLMERAPGAAAQVTAAP